MSVAELLEEVRRAHALADDWEDCAVAWEDCARQWRERFEEAERRNGLLEIKLIRERHKIA